VSKLKSVYFIEIRRRKGEGNYPLRQNFGAFGSLKKARKWVVENGRETIKDFAKGHPHKELFFMILENLIDSPGNEWGYAVLALDLDGETDTMF